MNEDNDDLERLGHKLGRALRTGSSEGAPASLRARIRAATAKEMILPSWRWAAAAACAVALVAIGVWQMPQAPQLVTKAEMDVDVWERQVERPLLLLEAARELEEENQFVAVELYREACSTATHPVVAWLAANEVSRLENNQF